MWSNISNISGSSLWEKEKYIKILWSVGNPIDRPTITLIYLCFWETLQKMCKLLNETSPENCAYSIENALFIQLRKWNLLIFQFCQAANQLQSYQNSPKQGLRKWLLFWKWLFLSKWLLFWKWLHSKSIVLDSRIYDLWLEERRYWNIHLLMPLHHYLELVEQLT